jgi:hypothetical protein
MLHIDHRTAHHVLGSILFAALTGLGCQEARSSAEPQAAPSQEATLAEPQPTPSQDVAPKDLQEASPVAAPEVVQPAPAQTAAPKDPQAAPARDATPMVPPAASAQDAAPKSVTWTQAELEGLSRKIQADIEQLRGEKFRENVNVKVADRATMIEYLKRRTEEDEPPEKLAADERIAKHLALVPPEMNLLEETYRLIESQVAGFYDPPANTFFLMDSMPKGFAGAILAHELIHALDDQLYGLDTILESLGDDTDAVQAYRFLAEGSAMSGGTVWAVQHIKDIDISGYQGMLDEQQAELTRAPTALWKPLVGAYFQGAAFVARASSVGEGQMKSAKSVDIRAAFQRVPRSTEQVLHPEKYWNPEQVDLPRPVSFEVGALPDGWTVRRQDTLGELGLALVVTPRDAPGLDLSNPASLFQLEFTNAAAAGWGGDRLILLGKDDASWLRLVTVWDSAQDAAEFFGAVQMLQGHFERACTALGAGVRRGRSGVEIQYGASPDQVQITLWSGVERDDLEHLPDAVVHVAQ